MGLADRLYALLISRNSEDADQLPEPAARHVPSNAMRLVSASALQSSGDQVVNASTVLTWLLNALGAPAALVGLLVPIRESGSMLPQALLTPMILRVRYRKWVFVTGALVQAAAVAVMAATAALGNGTPAGLIIIGALVVFALGRSLCSVASKDVQGRTIPKGQRGKITGLATATAGLVAITVGLVTRLVGGDEMAAESLAWLLGAGAVAWLVAAGVYASVREPADKDIAVTGATSEPETEGKPHWFARTFQVLRTDRDFRRFVTMRSFLLVSALSPPFIVTLSIDAGSSGLAGLGGFLIASGVSALIGGRIFGGLADRSSRRLMAVGAAVASVVIVALVAAASVPIFSDGSAGATVMFVAGYFLLTLIHTGVRIGRKTYVIDMAEGDLRTTYVAVSNSAMGLILLVVGGISAVIALVAVSWALLFLAALGLVGAVTGIRLPEVSRR